MDETRADETREEMEVSEETGATPEEAHRIGEFHDLREMLETLLDKVSGISEQLSSFSATAIDNGAEVRDVDGDGDADVIIADDDVEIIPEVEDMDLDI